MRRNNEITRPPGLWPPRTLGTGVGLSERTESQRGERGRKGNALAVSVAAGAARTSEPCAWPCPAHAGARERGGGRTGTRRKGER